jgi:hypothetical protein
MMGSEPLLPHEVQALMFLLQGPDTPGAIDSEEKLAAVIVFEMLKKRGLVIADIGDEGPTYRLTREGMALAKISACADLQPPETRR